MWPDKQPLRSISRFRNFGLRREWLQLYLDHPQNWKDCGCLGNQQIIALSAWLRTLGILGSNAQETSLAAHCRAVGLDDFCLWQELWVRSVFNFNGVAWYVYQGTGQRTAEQLRSTLAEDAPQFSPYGIRRCLLEVVSFLANTPVGDRLGQGLVQGSHKRTITRSGLPTPDPAAAGLALALLFQRERVDYLKMNSQCLWPWTVFGCTADVIRRQLADDTRFSWERDAVRFLAL